MAKLLLSGYISDDKLLEVKLFKEEERYLMQTYYKGKDVNFQQGSSLYKMEMIAEDIILRYNAGETE